MCEYLLLWCACRGRKTSLDALELELQVVTSYHVVMGNKSRSSTKEASTSEGFHQTLHCILKWCFL